MTVTIKVVHDTDTESPRTWGNVGTMVCWHRRYNLGDIQPKESPEEWTKANVPKGSIVLPLYLYDHSGITMSTGSFGDRWDSGQVGIIFATPDAIREGFMVKRITKAIRVKVEERLKSEVAIYDDFLTGNVWGYIMESTHDCSECSSKVREPEAEDSCFGFYGDDLDGMKVHVPEKYHDLLKAAWDNRG